MLQNGSFCSSLAGEAQLCLDCHLRQHVSTLCRISGRPLCGIMVPWFWCDATYDSSASPFVQPRSYIGMYSIIIGNGTRLPISMVGTISLPTPSGRVLLSNVLRLGCARTYSLYVVFLNIYIRFLSSMIFMYGSRTRWWVEQGNNSKGLFHLAKPVQCWSLVFLLRQWSSITS